MTLEALRCFCAVVEAASFRRGAERVHRSQPAVSQQIKALEGAIGHPLLERKTCRLTPRGEVLYARARRLLNDSESLSRELEDFDEAADRELRLGASDTTALYILPPYVRAFSKAMPRTRLIIISRSSDATVDHVLRGELGLGIVTLPMAHEDLEEKALFPQRLILVVPRNHRLASRKRVTLSALQGEPMLLLDPRTRTGGLLREHFRVASFEPQVAIDSGSFEVIKRYVAEGIGIAFLPKTVVTKADRSLAMVQVPGLPRVTVGAIWRRGAYQTKAERTFLDLMS